MENPIKQYIEFEKKMMQKPKVGMFILEQGLKVRRNLIWKEFIEWQNAGGKIKDIKFSDFENNVIVWKIGNETFAQKINELAPFSKEEYKKGLSAVYSFMQNRIQYFKFRKMEGMFNPLRVLLFEIIHKYDTELELSQMHI